MKMGKGEGKESERWKQTCRAKITRINPDQQSSCLAVFANLVHSLSRPLYIDLYNLD